MFGRQPKLPIDLAFGLITEKERKPHTKDIQEARERLVQAFHFPYYDKELFLTFWSLSMYKVL
jgi:hypothetical protein